MKRISILFFIASLFFTSCSNDDPSPDLTTDFIGTWKSGIEEDQYVKSWSTWNISKVSNNEVKLTISSFLEAQPGVGIEFEGPNPSVDIIEKVRLIDSRTMDLNFDMTIDGEESTNQGTGIITGNKLALAMKTTYKKDGEVLSYSESLTRQ
ncbi:hypothetical protein [Dyadobacter bucti]|uniref:hypothetical protein n=1 Tax=Dyadobacter bucti TaxID=2572203 RepID=UPI003F6F758A